MLWFYIQNESVPFHILGSHQIFISVQNYDSLWKLKPCYYNNRQEKYDKNTLLFYEENLTKTYERCVTLTKITILKLITLSQNGMKRFHFSSALSENSKEKNQKNKKIPNFYIKWKFACGYICHRCTNNRIYSSKKVSKSIILEQCICCVYVCVCGITT